MKNKDIYVLCGHKIPDKVEAFSIFIGKPTKEQLLATERFSDNTELEHKLIDCLLEHGICGTYKESTDFRYEYLFINPDNLGDLRLYDLLYTGILDCKPELLVIL